MPIKKKFKTDKELAKVLADAWLQIKINETDLGNPLDWPSAYNEEPYKYITWMMTQPEYFGFICHEILNVKLLPTQVVMLNAMWNSKFPMLIASRGFGKCVTGDTYIMTESGIVRIGDLLGYNSTEMCKQYGMLDILNENNSFTQPEYGWNNGFSNTLKLTTSQGFQIEGTLNHPIRVVRNNVLEWVELKDIKINDYIPIDRSKTWFENTTYIHKDLAYLFGLLVGDGGYTIRGRISFTSKDEELHQEVNRISGFYLYKHFSDKRNGKITSLLYSTDVWDSLFSKYGFNSSECGEKDFPSCILRADKESVAYFIRGLFDTDGYCKKNYKWIEWCSKSEKLARTLQFVLTRFGIISRIKPRLNKKYNTTYYYLYIFGDNVNKFYQEIGFGLNRKQDNLKQSLSIKTNTNLDIIPTELIYNDLKDKQLLKYLKNRKNLSYNKFKMLNIDNVIVNKNYFYDKVTKLEKSFNQTFDIHCKNDHSFISNGMISHNTFILAVYCLLRILLMPRRNVVIAGAVFRQSKFIFEYMEQIWWNAPLLRDIAMITEKDGPHHDTDNWTFSLSANQSKCTAIPIGDGCGLGNTLVTYNDCFGRLDRFASINDIQINPVNASVFGNKKYRNIDECYNNGKKLTKLITTKKGYVFEGTYNHALKILEENNIGWCRLDDMKIGNRILIDNSIRWHKGDFNCDIDEAYCLGLLIGDGCWTNRYKLRFTTKDYEFLYYLEKSLKHKYISAKDGVHFDFNSKKLVKDWLDFWGLQECCYTIDKILPPNILRAEQNKMTACLQGLFDADGHVFVTTAKGGTAISVNFTNTSEMLVRQIQYILLHYGIVSVVKSRQRKNKNWNRVYELGIYGTNVKKFAEQINFRLTRKKEILQIAIKNKKRWTTQEEYYNNIFIDEIVSIEDSKGETFDIHVPEDNEYCASGFFSHNSKIRGLRAHDLITDEFAAISKEIFEVVLSGFASVKSHPIDGVISAAAEQLAREMDVWEEEEETDFNPFLKDNQIIISGTADYEFKHYGDYWKRYRDIILTRGNTAKLEEILKRKAASENRDYEGIPNHFNWKHYSIIRVPVELIPAGFMDMAVVSRAKAASHLGIYQMEFGACQSADTLITTDSGLKRIIDIEKGDLVLTHKGRFRRVTKKLYRKYENKVIKYKTCGYNRFIITTPNHPYWIGEDNFKEIGNGLDNTFIANLDELNGMTEFYSESVLNNVLETLDKNRLYPQSSQSKISLQQQREIRQSIFSQRELAKKYEICQSAISYIQTNNNIPKNSIPKIISLDYNFGLIIGYYAAEGSISIDGKAVEFALDEHKDTQYQNQLLQAINKVFGFCAKSYIKKQNTIVISINSRIVVDIIHNICPGLSATKLINHKILFSNEDFLRGVITSYWNGDGYIGNISASVHCINQNLLNQIRIGLSYFNISSSIMNGSQGNDFYLKLCGNNFRDFLSEFYGKVTLITQNKQYIKNDGEKCILPITNFIVEDYDDYVYNLEVEEDNSYSTLNATVHNCFSKDSNGFFKRSLIESCVVSPASVIVWPSCDRVIFEATLHGNPKRKYIYGIDPASEINNFAITVLELWPDHQRVVYTWSTNREQHKEEQKAGLINEQDFYHYCAKKIRSLMKKFPCERIMMDSQGGGIAVMEALHDSTKINPLDNERPIWPIIDPDDPKDSDMMGGDHIVELVNFADYTWTAEANHMLRKDLEDKALLFPYLNSLTLALRENLNDLAEASSGQRTHIYDTLEDCIMEIERLKDELATIVITRTPTGKDHWDTPEIKLPGGKKGRLQKDRYSALVMANMGARQLIRNPDISIKMVAGGFAGYTKKEDGQLFEGNQVLDAWARDFYR